MFCSAERAACRSLSGGPKRRGSEEQTTSSAEIQGRQAPRRLGLALQIGARS
jgi:hypothetical protein